MFGEEDVAALPPPVTALTMTFELHVSMRRVGGP